MKKAIHESKVNAGRPVETYNMKTAMFLQLNLFGFLRKSLVIPMVMASKWRNLQLMSFMCYILLIGSSYSETDTLLQGQQLKYGGRLVSAFGNFRLAFFPEGDNIGIWHVLHEEDRRHDYYRNRYRDPYYRYGRAYYYYRNGYPYQYSNSVWYALQHKQINGSAILTIGRDRNLMILRSGGDPIAITSVQGISGHTSAALLDSGNFVLRELNIDGTVKRVLWQSFDYPTDTLLPGMKLGINYLTGRKWSLTAGSFTFGLDSTINGTSRLVIWWAGDVYWTSRNWTNESFSLVPGFPYKFEYYSNENEKYFTYHVNDDSIAPARITIDRDGILSSSEGTLVSCGAYDYGTLGSIGCVEYPECRKEISDFYRKWGVVVPGNGSVLNESSTFDIKYCREKCLRDCSCVAYAATNWRDETGCQIWSNVTIDTTRPGDALPIYVIQTEEKKRKKRFNIGVGLALTASSLCILCLLIWRLHKDYATITDAFLRMLKRLLQIWRRSKEKAVEYLHSMKKTDTEQEILLHELGIDRRQNHSRHERNSHELRFFSFESIVSATTNFAPINKLGEGGFGPVYKGKFPDGLEVAIKRLSTNSRQGLVEFKNEVKVIAKLQHNNLVRLLGCCIEREEKLLIYEFMPNKSLDFFLFDPMNKSSLDWKTRFNIIEGIAQGLLYLHKYSRLKIIHRDLKASNVLLGSDMNPKISDFGMAKIFGSDESKANTNRVVGTYGYMPPEYAFEGIFSTKSDVFSYGVLLLEITSGRRNNSFHDADGPLNLVVHAWELWKQGGAREMIDSTINDEFRNEVLRCIHIGLLCTQENPMDRPAMLDVTSMLYNDAYQLPSPQKPAFYGRRNLQVAEIAGQKQEQQSVNEASITEMEAR